MHNQTPPFIVDYDTDFVRLRTDMRNTIRASEIEMRAGMAGFVANIASKLKVETSEDLGLATVEVTARFLRACLPFFSGLNDLLNAHENAMASPSLSVN